MAKYKPKEISYPLSTVEFHIVTQAGVPAYITNSIDLARAKLKTSDPSHKLIAVETIKRDITPRRRKPIVRTDDAPLAMCA